MRILGPANEGGCGRQAWAVAVRLSAWREAEASPSCPLPGFSPGAPYRKQGLCLGYHLKAVTNNNTSKNSGWGPFYEDKDITNVFSIPFQETKFT